MPPGRPEQLEAGREASARHDWGRAFDLLSQCDAAEALGPQDLERLGEAAFWLGRIPDAIRVRERSATGYAAAGDRLGEARVSMSIAGNHFWQRSYAVGGGWFQKAQRLLAEEPESREHGQLAVWRAHMTIPSGQLEAALEAAAEAQAIGRRLGDRDLQAHGLNLEGSIRVRLGQVERGMALIDESMASAVAGDLGPFATATIYCTTISACHRIGDYRRAAEWTQAAETCAARPGMSDYPGDCRAHRVGVLRMHGAWEAALREGEAAERVEGQEATHVGMALYEVGEIQLRRGALEAAEATFQRAEDLGRAPQPGRALLCLARGKPDAAWASIEGALADEPWDRLVRARLLPAAVEIALAGGDAARARSASEELAEIAATYDTLALKAAAHGAEGCVRAAAGGQGASEALRQARRLWQEVDAPYELARARLWLAEHLASQGDREGGAAEARAARSLFERLGAGPDAARARRIEGSGETGEARSRGTRTFLFTDIVGSTALVEAIGDDAWASLVRWHDQALREQFTAHAGEEVDHAGDGFFVAFEDPGRGIACAVAIQRALAAHRETHGFAPQVRIGLHTAEAIRQAEGYTGSGVHRAARIGALAQGGEILVSAETWEGGREGFEASPTRRVALKGLSEPAQVVQVRWTRSPEA